MSRIKVIRLIKESGDLSSDSTKGTRLTSHIRSARFIMRSHCAALSAPKLAVMASKVSLRERLANLTLLPSAKR
ncbi:unannotated protein [freshwater metagenome]|uniref:Unannotated protein n=1 Tax=freshwater metagenome TaxID=449393 RepID=A0A6J6B371_9ZZZZ